MQEILDYINRSSANKPGQKPPLSSPDEVKAKEDEEEISSGDIYLLVGDEGARSKLAAAVEWSFFFSKSRYPSLGRGRAS